LAATSQKTTVLPLLATKKMENAFYVEFQKTLVTKVAGLGNMHISTKMGP
jgi:hypothetical protein